MLELPLTQTSSEGSGSAQTELTDVATSPCGAPSSIVVTMQTPAASRRIPRLNDAASITTDNHRENAPGVRNGNCRGRHNPPEDDDNVISLDGLDQLAIHDACRIGKGRGARR